MSCHLHMNIRHLCFRLEAPNLGARPPGSDSLRPQTPSARSNSRRGSHHLYNPTLLMAGYSRTTAGLVLALTLAAVFAPGTSAAQTPDNPVSSNAPRSPGITGDIRAGTYRVVLQLPGGELPFGLDLERNHSGWIGYLINGQERLKLSEVAVDGSHLQIRMPGYQNRLTADARGDH